MHVLITGGARFIGSHTVEALLKGGATVRVLDNLSAGKRQNLQDHKKLELQVRKQRCECYAALLSASRGHPYQTPSWVTGGR